jgi:coproporphyrinogen III oxidase-like Fe-S oxidoreductase
VLTETTLPVSSLYVHVPFCARKCEYCAFYSEASDGEVIHRYVSSLVRELEHVASDVRPKTIFFGGGTPSLLNLAQWTTILDAMERLGLLGAEEFTVECNPATVSLDKAKLLARSGVNRVSMGVQSLDESLLDRLGRVHHREMVFKSFDTFAGRASTTSTSTSCSPSPARRWTSGVRRWTKPSPSAANIFPATKSSTKKTRRSTHQLQCRANLMWMKISPATCMRN